MTHELTFGEKTIHFPLENLVALSCNGEEDTDVPSKNFHLHLHGRGPIPIVFGDLLQASTEFFNLVTAYNISFGDKDLQVYCVDLKRPIAIINFRHVSCVSSGRSNAKGKISLECFLCNNRSIEVGLPDTDTLKHTTSSLRANNCLSATTVYSQTTHFSIG